MLSFGDKAILKAELFPPRIGFDADNLNFSVIRTDDRDLSSISYSLAGGSLKDISNGKLTPYNLSKIDTYYTLSVSLTPKNSKYKGNTTNIQIFKNHEDCKYFKYSGNDYESTDIYKYTGIKNNIVIPTKHNMVNTLSATILEFPNVSSDTITITTPKYMSEFNIRDDRITEFTVNGSLNPIPYQFGNFPILTNVNGSFSICSDYMFYNSPNLSMNPNNTKNMGKIGKKAFFNLPKQKVVRIAADELPIDSFGYDNAYGENDLQKIIFTSSNTINGYNQRKLYNGAPTKGMKYTDPNDGVEKSHQVFCGLTEEAWEEEAPESDVVYVKGHSTTSNQYPNIVWKFRADDPRVMGLYMRVVSINGSEKGCISWLPKDVKTSTVQNRFKRYSTYKDFYLSETNFYDDGTFPREFDRFYIRAISKDGLGDEYISTKFGLLKELSGIPINKVISTDGVYGDYTVVVNDGEYNRKLYSTAPIYKLWITCDPGFEQLQFIMYNSDITDTIDGLNGESWQFIDLSESEYLSLGGRKVFIIDLKDYYDEDDLENSTNIFKIGYSGWPDDMYEISLKRQLNGYTKELIIHEGFTLGAKKLTMRPRLEGEDKMDNHLYVLAHFEELIDKSESEPVYCSWSITGDEEIPFNKELDESITLTETSSNMEYVWTGENFVQSIDSSITLNLAGGSHHFLFEGKDYRWNGDTFVYNPYLELESRQSLTGYCNNLYPPTIEGDWVITAKLEDKDKIYQQSLEVNVYTFDDSPRILTDTYLFAKKDIKVAACLPGKSSATITGIANDVKTFFSLGGTYWLLWLVQDFDVPITAELYTENDEYLATYNLDNYLTESYPYSHSQEYNLISWPNKSSKFYLKCWYTSNPSKGTFIIPLTGKYSYSKSE